MYLLEFVTFHSHVLAVCSYLGFLGRLGHGCSSGQNDEQHQKLWRKIERLTAV
jgi:hypothetical protein